MIITIHWRNALWFTFIVFFESVYWPFKIIRIHFTKYKHNYMVSAGPASF